MDELDVGSPQGLASQFSGHAVHVSSRRTALLILHLLATPNAFAPGPIVMMQTFTIHSLARSRQFYCSPLSQGSLGVCTPNLRLRSPRSVQQPSSGKAWKRCLVMAQAQDAANGKSQREWPRCQAAVVSLVNIQHKKQAVLSRASQRPGEIVVMGLGKGAGARGPRAPSCSGWTMCLSEQGCYRV